MPVDFPAGMRAAAERPHEPLPWIRLLRLVVQRRTKTLPAVVLQINNGDSEIVWPPAPLRLGRVDIAANLTWYPVPFRHTPIVTNAEGDLQHIDINLDNTTRFLMPSLHSGSGFEGNAATLIKAHASTIAVPEFKYYNFTIAQASASSSQITFRCEDVNMFEERRPGSRFTPKCRFEFGGPRCGYPITPAAAFTTCPRTVGACIERGNDEAARRLPKLHPKRFGGFPGVDPQRAG